MPSYTITEAARLAKQLSQPESNKQDVQMHRQHVIDNKNNSNSTQLIEAVHNQNHAKFERSNVSQILNLCSLCSVLVCVCVCQLLFIMKRQQQQYQAIKRFLIKCCTFLTSCLAKYTCTHLTALQQNNNKHKSSQYALSINTLRIHFYVYVCMLYGYSKSLIVTPTLLNAHCERRRIFVDGSSMTEATSVPPR